jgi:hypothetical protein
MSPADRIAIWTKAQLAVLNGKHATPDALLIPFEMFELLRANPDPCATPDLNEKQATFCGVPVLRGGDRIGFVYYFPVGTGCGTKN